MLKNIVDEFINKAESLYGKKTGDYFVEIDEQKSGVSETHIGIISPEIIKIFITDNAYNSFYQNENFMAYNQIGHEVIHALMQPQANGNANYLEEGLAVFFSIQVLLDKKVIEENQVEDLLSSLESSNLKYWQAYTLVKETSIYKDIKTLRVKNPFLAQLKLEDLSNLDIDTEIKEMLLTNFKLDLID